MNKLNTVRIFRQVIVPSSVTLDRVRWRVRWVPDSESGAPFNARRLAARLLLTQIKERGLGLGDTPSPEPRIRPWEWLHRGVS